MTEQFESESELREREATTDDGGDVAETPEDEHARDADEVTRPAGPAPDERTTSEPPSGT